MQTVLLVVHLLIAAGLVGVVLLQRSEGGALGIGGSGGGGGGFLTGRGTANLLTRVTAGLAAAFFVTSMALTMMAQSSTSQTSIVGREPAGTTAPAGPSAPAGTPAAPGETPAAPAGGILDRLNKGQPAPPLSK